MSTAVRAALVRPWLVAAAVFPVSVMDMATLLEATVTTRQDNATAPTILRDHTVNPACLVTTETPGIYFECNVVFSLFLFFIQTNCNKNSK